MVNTAITRSPRRRKPALALATTKSLALATTAALALATTEAPASAEAEAPVPRRRLSAAQREQQILLGAVDFFSRRGLDGQTRELADELGITHALLFHYFPSKGKLIERVYEQVIAGRWNPTWEALLDGPLPVQDKLCRFYDEYLAAILTPEWLRILVHSGLVDGLIPERYFGLLRERLFPRLLREARRAHGSRSRAAASVREEALLLGLHGGLVYRLGILPLIYGQPSRGHDDHGARQTFIADMVQGYLAQAAHVLPGAERATRATRATRTDRATP